MTPLLVPLVSGAAVAFWICAPLMVIGALGMVPVGASPSTSRPARMGGIASRWMGVGSS